MKTAENTILLSSLNIGAQAARFMTFIVIAVLFGANSKTDAFFLALSVPNVLVYPIIATLKAVFIPVFNEWRVKNENGYIRLVGSAITFCSLISLGLMLILCIFTPVGLEYFVPTRDAIFRQTVFSYILILCPTIILQLNTGILSAVYNTNGNFWLPAGAETIRFIIGIILIYGLKPVLGDTSLPVSFTCGAFIQILLLIAFWRRTHTPIHLNFGLGGGVARALRLTLPLLIGSAVLQFSGLICRILATRLGEGSISILDYANRISTALMEVLSGGIFVITLTEWSQAAAQKDILLLRVKLPKLSRMLLFFIIPIILLLILLREPAIRLIWQSGQVDATTIKLTGGVMIFYLLGLPVDSIGRLFTNLFMALQKTWISGVIAIIRTIFTLSLSVFLMPIIGLTALALADTISIAMVVFLLGWLVYKFTGIKLSGMGIFVLKTSVAVLGCYLTGSLLFYMLTGLSDLMILFLVSFCAGSIYLLLSWLMKTSELTEMVHLLHSRFFKSNDLSRET
jgi:putative peptidoglycan lipid II flippase